MLIYIFQVHPKYNRFGFCIYREQLAYYLGGKATEYFPLEEAKIIAANSIKNMGGKILDDTLEIYL